MKWIFLVPGLLQSVLMAVDEFYCHQKRLLPRWERLGHPIDTLTLLICLCLAVTAPWGDRTVQVFIPLALFSCLCVTKDEWIHHQYCTSFEQWIHAVLFILHPLVLICILILWWISSTCLQAPWRIPYFEIEVTQQEAHQSQSALKAQFLCVSAFFIYQMVYWNWIKPLKGTDR